MKSPARLGESVSRGDSSSSTVMPASVRQACDRNGERLAGRPAARSPRWRSGRGRLPRSPHHSSGGGDPAGSARKYRLARENKGRIRLDAPGTISYLPVYRHGFARVGEGEASANPDRHLTGGPLSRSSGTGSPERAAASAKAFSGSLAFGTVSCTTGHPHRGSLHRCIASRLGSRDRSDEDRLRSLRELYEVAGADDPLHTLVEVLGL